MIIVDFERKHAEAAAELAMAGYEDERRKVPSLPEVTELPDLTPFANNCLGVAAFEGEKCWDFYAVTSHGSMHCNHWQKELFHRYMRMVL